MVKPGHIPQTLEDVVASAIEFAPVEELDFTEINDPDDFDRIDHELSMQPANDYGNALRLMKRGGQNLIWVDDCGWFGWNGKCWSLPEGQAQAVKISHETVTAMREEVGAAMSRGLCPGELSDDYVARIKKLHAFRIKSGDINRVRAMLDSAAVYLNRPIGQLDANPMLFNVENGTIVLNADPDEDSTDVVRVVKHRRDDLLTKAAPVAYDPAAECPHFRKFLADILPDEEIQNFLQVWFGYSLSGLIQQQYVVMFYGGGSNGKSTLLDTLNHILGEYALTLPFASLLKDDKKRGAEATPDLARLPGARFVTAAEPEVGSQFSESTLKQLTGGEKITARHLNKGFFEFYPQFKLVLSFNQKPQIRGQDDGIWRRVLLVPFAQKFVPLNKMDENPGAKPQDPTLTAKLKGEASGILNWMLDGWRIYMEQGLVVPDIVKAATNEYRQESNPVGEFINAWTTRAAGEEILSSKLYRAYQEYCKVDGIKPWTTKTFGDRLTEQGAKRQKIGGYTYYLDIKLTDEAEKAIHGGLSSHDPRSGND